MYNTHNICNDRLCVLASGKHGESSFLTIEIDKDMGASCVGFRIIDRSGGQVLNTLVNRSIPCPLDLPRALGNVA